MTDAKHDDSFKVIDRRHFTETGDLREGVIEQEKREEEAAKKAAEARAKAAAKQGAAGAGSTSSLTGAKTPDGSKSAGTKEATFPSAASGGTAVGEGAEAAQAGEIAAGETTPASRSFQMLVDFLTRNAAAMLGGMADPRTGQTFLDLEGAREIIDMLDMLREKTMGRLSKEDDQLLLEVLGSLKLTFMEISKAAAEQMAKKAKTK